MPDQIKGVEYKDAIAMLEKVGGGEEARGLELDFQGGFSDSAENRLLEYGDELDKIAKVEGVRRQQVQRKQDIQIFQKDANISTNMEPEKSFKVDSIVHVVNKPSASPYAASIKNAAADIRGIVETIEKDVGIKGKKTAVAGANAQNREGMVMDELSVQDQISDLEKISLGLDQNAFDDEQVATIKEEVENLMNSAKNQKAARNADDAQRSMLLLRNQRLQDVINKLSLNN